MTTVTWEFVDARRDAVGLVQIIRALLAARGKGELRPVYGSQTAVVLTTSAGTLWIDCKGGFEFTIQHRDAPEDVPTIHEGALMDIGMNHLDLLLPTFIGLDKGPVKDGQHAAEAQLFPDGRSAFLKAVLLTGPAVGRA